MRREGLDRLGIRCSRGVRRQVLGAHESVDAHAWQGLGFRVEVHLIWKSFADFSRLDGCIPAGVVFCWSDTMKQIPKGAILLGFGRFRQKMAGLRKTWRSRCSAVGHQTVTQKTVPLVGCTRSHEQNYSIMATPTG